MHTCRFAVENRNKSWFDSRLTDLLREHNVEMGTPAMAFM
jgi:hypothetical protein